MHSTYIRQLHHLGGGRRGRLASRRVGRNGRERHNLRECRHSVHVPMFDEEDEWVCYFANEHDVVDFQSQTMDAILDRKWTWFFPRELVI
jgi:hypothetical protein